ncbi:DH domain-containing protein [Aphelenchoides besseyi]|nr:DH domain-containing protein [Aphelenchoides besseyi]
MDTPQSPSSPQKFNYWREACKSLPGLLQNFDQPPSDRPPPIPCVLLDLPQSDSSTSREPSPVSTSTNNSHRRYLPRTRERRTVRRNFDDELQLSQSVEEFGFLEGSGRRAQRASSDTDEQPARWTSPIRAFSSSSSQNRGVYRKLSIRRRQPLTVMANFDDVVCYSGDELERKNSRSALAVHSGSLPSIVQATTISTDDVEWKPSNAEPPLISPILSVDPINHKPVQLSSDENGNDELNNHHESEVDSPFSNPPEPPTSAPAFTENGTVFAFERRRSLVQELPAISEDPPECNVVPTETMQFRSTSDRALDSKNDDTDENKRRSMIIITGNPNHVDDDPPLLSTPKSKSTTAIGGAPCHLVRSTNRHTIDRIDTRAHSPEYANGGILRQDDSKTLHFVEPTQRRSQIQNDDDLKSTSPSPPTYSPELNQRKIRLQRRKTVGPKKKTIQARRAPVDDIIHPSLIEDAAAEEEEEEAVGHISIIRSVSSFGFSNGDKEKKREGVISALLSVRQNKRKPSRASLHDTGSIVSTDRSKRRSLIEHTWRNGKTSTDGLPDALAYALSAPSENDLRNVQQNGVNGIQWPQLNKKKWEDLCIWNEDPANWSTQNSKVEISAGEEKRQNVIYEFYTTEKRHCQTLIFLQQVFQVGFIHHNILSETETKLLIPDVIDSLLDFHLNLLRRIRQRILAGPIVRTISDIVCEEFKNGEHRAAATKAYTNFTLAHGEADSRYNDYMKKNPQFNAFCKNLDQYPKSKERNFKSCYLLITQRLTHYPTFITRLIKCETCGELKNLSQNALRATENFALQVNNDLSSILLNRRFDHVCSIMDRTSVGKVLGQRFAFEDLMLNGIERKIYSIGNVWFEIPQQSIELTLLLFDDVLVFLQSKNNQLHFFSHKNQASVLPLSTLLIREMPRSNELMLIEPMTPDMCQLKFNNRSDMNQWMQALKDAQAMAPKFVRLSNRKMKIEGKLGQNVDRNTEVSEESKYNEELQKWEDRLDEIFLSRINKESKLKLYMEERMAFMDDLRSHLLNFPNSTNFDFNSSSSSKTRELTKMKTLLNTHFCDLRAFRRTALDKLVERAQKFRDSDISSFFDDLQELYHPNSSDSTALSSSSNDENPEKPSTSANCRKPRRSKTWNYGNAESIYQKEGVRRHTTMPKMQSFAHHPLIEEDGEDVRLDKQLQRLPVNLNSKTRRVATEIILENLRLRDQNDQLREENARNAMHLAAIRARKTPFAETTEKLESLRQKQEEVQNKEVTFRRECEKRLDELRQWEEELRSRENELVERTQTLNDERSGPPDSANSSGISRDTSFRGGAVILDQRQSSPSTTMNKPQNSVEKTVPKHLAESKPKRRTKN